MSVAVVGSINEDLVVEVDRHPFPGETVLARRHSTGPGGKGANQAVAAARLGARVAMVGCVGRDDSGTRMLEALRSEQVDVSGVRADPEAATGLAVITVDRSGENAIVVSAGANRRLSRADVDAAASELDAAAVTLIQLEIPMEAVRAAVAAAGHRVVLNPAPARTLPQELLRVVDVLVPNRHELGLLAGVPVPGTPDEASKAAARIRGPGAVVATLGPDGAVVVARDRSVHVPTPFVDVVDTTGAGDAFCGALADGLDRGLDLVAAVERATAAGALATTRLGARAGLPDGARLGAFLDRR